MARLFSLFLLLTVCAQAQGPGVPIYQEGRGAQVDTGLLAKAKALLDSKALVPLTQFESQMNRLRCELTLPPPETKPLTSRERWQRARAAHLRVGFYYLCTKCDNWHLDLAGGYAITADGAVATCAHVVTPPDQMKEGYMVVATDDDVLMPVTEVLAVNAGRDSAILRVKGPALTPLPLSSDVTPGDPVWCFSDPSDARGYYSEGIVSRFSQRPFLKKKEQNGVPAEMAKLRPVWLETTLDWAPGSSGSALVDAFGNCVGHVSEIQAIVDDTPVRPRAKAKAPQLAPGTYIVFHQAIAAAEVRALIRTP